MRKELFEGISEAEVFRIVINNDSPVLLNDLVSSFAAFSEQYSRHNERLHGNAEFQQANLYIRSVREGSIITELVSLADQLGLLDNPREALAPFAAHLNDSFQYLMGLTHRRSEIDKKDLRDLNKIAEVIAKDPGSSLTFSVYNGPVQINNYNYSSQDMNSVQSNIRREMAKTPFPETDMHQKELFYWWQARGDLRAKAGDRGKIERFSNRPIKVIFPSEEIKAQLLDTESNPFKLVFVVDVQVERIEEQIVAYRIIHVHDSFDPNE